MGTNAAKTIENLRHLFSKLGLPETLVCDNGPPNYSEEFQLPTLKWSEQ